MKFKVFRNVVCVLMSYWVFTMTLPLQSAEQPKKPEASSSGAISEKDLNAFVKAYVDYQNIRTRYGPVLERAKDAPEKKRIEQEANAKVKKSLDQQGLTAERYNKIFATVNGDPELRRKVLNKVETARRRS